MEVPASKIYCDRYEELADAEAPAKAAACKTAEEARSLRDNSPLNSHAEEIFEARMKELQPLGK